MKFNYRIVHTYFPPRNKNDVGTDQYALHKVWYDDDGNPTKIEAMPIRPITYDMDDLRRLVEQMATALERSVLEADEYGGLIQ